MTAREAMDLLQDAVREHGQGRRTEAIQACQRILAAFKDHPLAVHMLGLFVYEEGLQTLYRSVALQPGNAEFHNNVAGVLGQTKRYAEARRHIDEALRLNPDFALAQFNLGVNYEYAEDWVKAEAAYRRVIALLPSYLDATYRLGWMLYFQGRFFESINCHMDLFTPEMPPSLPVDGYPVLSEPQVVVVVTCKGRLAHLKQTLPRMLDFACDRSYRMVVVDYMDPDGSLEWCVAQRHPRLAAIRVLEDAEAFHKARAFNCGANTLPGDILCFVDADSVLDRAFLERAILPACQAGGVLTKRAITEGSFDTMGVCCARAAAYRDVKGYDEQLRGYGPEDVDFFARMRQVGAMSYFDPELYPHALSHSSAQRTAYYAIKSIKASGDRIVQRLFDRQRIVNPTGYGRGRVQFAAAETDFRIEPRTLSETCNALEGVPQ